MANMSHISIYEIHDRCLITTQHVIQRFGWHTISLTTLSNGDKCKLEEGINNSVLNWAWAMDRYRGDADNGIPNISLKVIEHDEPDALHAVIICKYDESREQFSICMLENFISAVASALTGKVLIIALIYSTTFCEVAELSEIYIQDPTSDAKPRYVSYGFAQVWDDHDKCRQMYQIYYSSFKVR
ncbi:hypothetical protein EPIR_2575 [Erwinia piriflorinigrans CFBP 5888]|uniref:Uncharacterized protein n=2 Tax=Erwinia piriflorinigrans TaxID=665097 RepID=V5ZAG3_9GAMM|nr:hypothetical protein EPIR_2575 [Erwinia piriflorinigrans CFBP 5888]